MRFMQRKAHLDRLSSGKSSSQRAHGREESKDLTDTFSRVDLGLKLEAIEEEQSFVPKFE